MPSSARVNYPFSQPQTAQHSYNDPTPYSPGSPSSDYPSPFPPRNEFASPPPTAGPDGGAGMPYSHSPGNTSQSQLIPPYGHSPLGPGARDPNMRYSPRATGMMAVSSPSSVSSHRGQDKYDISNDLALWGANVNTPEADDDLHNPDPARDRYNDKGSIFTSRGFMNLGMLFLLAAGLVMLFAGYPILTYIRSVRMSTFGAFNLGGVNASGQVPDFSTLIDPDTPQNVRTRTGFDGKTNYQLIFSDEFNTDGRSFYPGDDPYWEAVDLYYWGTENVEWYDPAAVTTANGSLVISYDEMRNHNLNFRGGMIQTWNKFCFTGGFIEASLQLPGSPSVPGLWPAFWTMGNLGRAGYGASLEGTWPYSYDSCDVGTLHNQTWPNGTPAAAQKLGRFKTTLSYLMGQKFSACTCPGEDHPGPKRSDGSYVGRSAPEIDVFEAMTDRGKGTVSQSGQWAPFNDNYTLPNVPGGVVIYDQEKTVMNSYTGASYQQATSAITQTNQGAYQLTNQEYDTYGFEYEPGLNGYITWMVSNAPVWTLNSAAMAPDPVVEIDHRPVPQEPLYIMFNLGISPGFSNIEWGKLKFPAVMKVDYVRVYQPENAINIGCDPKDFPTADYISRYPEAYNNPNLTTWSGSTEGGGYGKKFPKNRLVDTC